MPGDGLAHGPPAKQKAGGSHHEGSSRQATWAEIDQLIRPSVGGEIPRATSGKALFARNVPDTWLAPRMMGPLWPNSCRRGRLEVA
jgi:hypothetical protein